MNTLCHGFSRSFQKENNVLQEDLNLTRSCNLPPLSKACNIDIQILFFKDSFVELIHETFGCGKDIRHELGTKM